VNPDLGRTIGELQAAKFSRTVIPRRGRVFAEPPAMRHGQQSETANEMKFITFNLKKHFSLP